MLWGMPRSSVALRAVPLAALIAVAALAFAAFRPDPREIMLRVAAAGFVVGIGVGGILAVLVPVGWVALAWRRTVGRRRTAARMLAFLIAVLVPLALVAVAVVLYGTGQPSPTVAPEA